VPAADIKRGDGALYKGFTEAVCRVTKDSIAAPAGELIRVRPWQEQLLGHLLARRRDGRLRHREALIGIGRKNGKSGIGAPICLGSLVMGPEGGEVYSCAADRKQAGVVFDIARHMVQRDPELDALLKVYRDVIEFPKTGSIYRALSAEAFTKEGLNPHLVCFDEVHAQPNRELWDVMALAMGARVEPLMVGITTAGVRTDSTGQDSLCYSLYQHGIRVVNGEVEDPSFFFAWWEPWLGAEADHRDPQTWREANPGSTTWSPPRTSPRSCCARRSRSSARSAATSGSTASTAGSPAACGRPSPTSTARSPTAPTSCSPSMGRSPVTAPSSTSSPSSSTRTSAWSRRGRSRPTSPSGGCRAARSRTSSATAAGAGTSSRSRGTSSSGSTPRRSSRTRACRSSRSLSRSRTMGPATQRFYEAVMDAQITHDGDPVLARHINNATLKTDSRGSRITKDHRGSSRKIDAAVGAVMGLHRAAELYGTDDEVILW
jgi:hypothetical protein